MIFIAFTRPLKYALTAGLLAWLAGCATQPTPPTPTPSPTPTPAPAPLTYQKANWAGLPVASDQDAVNGFVAWRNGCTRLTRNPVWAEVCKEAANVGDDPAAVRAFMQSKLQPYALQNPDGSRTGLITGYYEPVYPGSLTRTERANVPVYGVPDDLITVDMADVYPELKGKRIRGRLVGKKLVAYPDSSSIDQSGIQATPLAWLENRMDLQFLQIQGSGRVKLADGSQIRLAYADQNGRPFKPIGRWLIDQGELKSVEVSMQAIRNWAQQHPDRTSQLLASNPSYVFFRTLPPANDGPQGALAVPLTAGYSVAIDPKAVPLGSLLWLATTRPDNGAPLQGPMAAQDTGGAIAGNVRADLFWGTGDAAGEIAGRTRQSGAIWLLWPAGAALPGG